MKKENKFITLFTKEILKYELDDNNFIYNECTNNDDFFCILDIATNKFYTIDTLFLCDEDMLLEIRQTLIYILRDRLLKK